MNKTNFLGLEEKYCNYEKANVVYYPVAFDKTTTYVHGAEQGPSAIITASQNLELYDIENDFSAYQQGIFTAKEKAFADSKQMIETVRADVLSHLKNNKFVVTVGGEHAISLAPIQAHRDHYGPISIVQFDAHSDLVYAYDNNIYSHASVMKRVQEESAIDSIVALGIRSMAEEEKRYMNYSRTFFAHDMHQNNQWMEKAISLLSDQVYITFDLDVFDSSIMPATGTPEPGGLFWHQVFSFIKLLNQKKNIIGFDVVELCPLDGIVAPDFLAAKLIYKTLSFIFKKRSSHDSRLHEKTFQTF